VDSIGGDTTYKTSSDSSSASTSFEHPRTPHVNTAAAMRRYKSATDHEAVHYNNDKVGCMVIPSSLLRLDWLEQDTILHRFAIHVLVAACDTVGCVQQDQRALFRCYHTACYSTAQCCLPPLLTTSCTVSNTLLQHSFEQDAQFKSMPNSLQSDSPTTCDTSALTSPEPSGYDTTVALPSTAVVAGMRFHSSGSSSNDELSSSSSSMRSVQPLPAQKAVAHSQRSSLHRQCDSPQRATSEATSEATSSSSSVRTNCAGTTATAAATATSATSADMVPEHDSGYLTDDSQASGSVRSIDSEHSSSSSTNKGSDVILEGNDLLIQAKEQEQHSADQHSSNTPTPANFAANADTATATAVDSASEASSSAADDSSSTSAAASVDAVAVMSR
jgi:hypothetical protein